MAPKNHNDIALQDMMAGKNIHVADVRIPVQKMDTYLKFHTFFHPHVCELIKNLNWNGIPGLLTLVNQQLNNDPSLGPLLKPPRLFRTEYEPTDDVHSDYPKEDVDFKGGAYSVYNWELFFHAPLLIANRLSNDQQFQEAQNWFHYIFNPTTSSELPVPKRYWNTLPFFRNTDPEEEQITKLLTALKEPQADKETRDEVLKQIDQWRDNPFDPHLIARLRITAYQKTVVMKYLANLIAWGDQLFRRETIESINEAAQLYILANNILGPRSEHIPQRGKIEAQSYNELKASLDAFSNALVELENEFPFSSNEAAPSNGGTASSSDGLGTAQALYFCIPNNEELLSYWDLVADRLFKIRHCMNIEGVVRQLPLFEPAIDPALLVRATAMGVSLDSVLGDINSPMPHYRFNYLIQKALELCGELKSLGGALLSVLEKKDAEELAMLRASQELELLKAGREIRVEQFLEAKAGITALERTKDVAQARQMFYEQVLAAGLSNNEQTQLDRLKNANDKQSEALKYELIAQAVSQIPNATIGTSGYSSPVLTAQFGGSNLASVNTAYSRYLTGQSAQETYEATKASIMGGYRRREAEWTLQLTLATREIAQIEQQIAAAEIRASIAQKELRQQDQQIENSAAVEEFMRTKYTNQELYSWMLSQISAVFFQTYKLVYDMAKKVEKAYRFERGVTSSSFIQFGYWDSLRKGLLSGERLHLDLKRLEIAYMDQNKREFELTKQISLVLHDPMALITLKETGRCVVDLPEALFDMDYPGHYMRRIKSVSLSVPCVTGPYTNVNCSLTLLSNGIRIDSNSQRPYLEEKEDTRFVRSYAALQSIATSHAQNDSGMFELNFRDERYLPFEGAGAVSKWRLEMPKECNAFDFDTISDVIIKINYTAREGGALLRKVALEAALGPPPQEKFQRMFSARHEFPGAWHQFLHPKDTDQQHALEIKLAPEHFPYRFRGNSDNITTSRVDLFLKLKDGLTGGPLDVTLTTPGGQHLDPAPKLESKLLFMGGILHDVKDVTTKAMGTWLLQVTKDDLAALTPDAIEDFILVYRYSVPQS